MNGTKRILATAIMLIVSLSFLVGVSTVTLAKTIEVPGDYTTLQRAINAARSGDKIVLTTRARTLRENIELRNDRRLTITTSSRTSSLPAYKAGLPKAKAKQLGKVLTAAEPALVPGDIECSYG
jgi:hypothetical protein